MEPNLAMLEDVVIDGVVYQREWWGSKHRDAYPQPVIAEPTYYGKPERASQAGAAQQRYSARELVYACVAESYQSVKAVCYRTGLSDRRVRTVLMHGAEDGTLDRIEQAGARKGLRPVLLYRRKQAAEAAA